MSAAPANAVEARGRVDALDLARALALVGMAIYHFTWDLADFHLAPPGAPFSTPMRSFSHIVASSFLLLVGVSLALAHQRAFNAKAFARRFALVAGAAALVTLASLGFAPRQAIYFGILHCIAAASLLALPFLAAPAWLSLVAGALAFAAPFLVRFSAFDSPALLWIGLGRAEPTTLDWRPLLPWAGVVLIGLGLARLGPVAAWLRSPTRWRAQSPIARGATFAGRHSLAVYLVHQPILIGSLTFATWAAGIGAGGHNAAFLAACEAACVKTARAAPACHASCACVADVLEKSGRMAELTQGALGENEKAALKKLADACYSR